MKFTVLVFANVLIPILTILSMSHEAAARGGGGSSGDYSLGINLGMTTTAQDDLNLLISRANTRAGGISTSSLNTAYEAGLTFGYRYSGTIFSLQFRPSYVYQVTSGSGAGGSFNYGMTGITFFPMLRLYPLENDFMKFFMQFGLGIGRANGYAEEAAARVEFEANSFGTILGLGAEFTIAPGHTLSVEGNYRYLTFDRNLASSATGTFDTSGANPSISQAAKNREVEIDGTDLQTRMSGLQFMTGYQFHF